MKPDSQADSVIVVAPASLALPALTICRKQACGSRSSIAALSPPRARMATAVTSVRVTFFPLTEPGAIRVAVKSLFTPNAPFRIKPRFHPPLWNWMWQFAKRCTQRQMLASGQHLQTILDSSIKEYRKLVIQEQLPCEWKDNGLLYVLRTKYGMDEFERTDRILLGTVRCPGPSH